MEDSISGRSRDASRLSPPPTPSLQSSRSLPNLAPCVPEIIVSSPPSQTNSPEGLNDDESVNGDLLGRYNLPRPKPLWLHNGYTKHIVKGNFMTLSTRPKTVEPGEWIAHQVVQQYRNLLNFVRVVHEKVEDGTTICNAQTCPRMSAGAGHSFTWLNQQKEPVEVTAHEYMSLMQHWTSDKIANTKIFPIESAGVSFAKNPAAPITLKPSSASGSPNSHGDDTPIPTSQPDLSTFLPQPPDASDWIGKRSGFPPDFFDICQTTFRQIFRVYTHLYWAHFIDPFYHLSLDKHLNSSFGHFILTATALDLLLPPDLEQMQPLIDLWAANGTFPPASKAYEYADVQAGEALLALSGLS